jgi:hypothetical protein
MRLNLILFLLILIPHSAFAKCKPFNSVYTDGLYEIYFDKTKEHYVTSSSLIMINTKTKKEYYGSMIYNNGYSIPNISFFANCSNDKKRKNDLAEEGFCSVYNGTVYTLDGENTNMGFSEDKLLLFPKLSYSFYGSGFREATSQNVIPKL